MRARRSAIGRRRRTSDDWAGKVVQRVAGHGLLVLSSEACQARSPILDPFTGEFPTYYEALFGDEHGTP
jgi:hypothetical protein